MTAVPFVAALNPSQRARAAGAPMTVDIVKLQPGEQMTVAWRGKPVWILYRGVTMLEVLSRTTQQLRTRTPPWSHD